VARTPGERGRIGTWLREQRLERGWATQEIARRELERLGRIRLAQSVYAEYESGRRVPTDATLEKLVAFYGTSPNEERDPADMAAALDRQTVVLERIAAGIELQAQAINALLAALVERDDRVDPEVREALGEWVRSDALPRARPQSLHRSGGPVRTPALP